MGVGWLTGNTHSKFKVLKGSGVAQAEFVFIALVRFREYCQNALKLISKWRLSLPFSVVCPIALNRLINIYQNHIVCLNLPRTHILLSIIFCLRMVCQVLDYVPWYVSTLTNAVRHWLTQKRKLSVHINIQVRPRCHILATFEPRACFIDVRLRVQPTRSSYARLSEQRTSMENQGSTKLVDFDTDVHVVYIKHYIPSKAELQINCMM